MLEDIFRKKGLAATGLRGHAAEDNPAAQDDLRIAREEVIRNRNEIEGRQRSRTVVFFWNAADEHLGQRAGRQFAQPALQAAAELVSLRQIAKHFRFDLFVFEDFFQQVLDVVNFTGDESEELLKSPMLFASNLAVENVVEEELRHHGRDHDVDFPSRQMYQHAFQ